MKRLALGLTPAIVLIVAGCTLGETVRGLPHARHYRGAGVTFTYPAAWSHHRRGFMSTMTEGFVDLSSQAMVNPCQTHGRKTTCSWPIRRLRPGGVVVDWSTGGGLVAPGHLPPVGVQVKVLRDPFCRRIGGERTLSARIVLRGHRSYFAYACLRGPGVAANTEAFRAMLASARPA